MTDTLTDTLPGREITTLGGLRILRAMAELQKVEARERREPLIVFEALDDAIDALAEAIAYLEVTERTLAVVRTEAPQLVHPDPVVAMRLEGAARRLAPVATCACDLWPLHDLEATQEDGVTVHGWDACVSRGVVTAERKHTFECVQIVGQPGCSCTGTLRGAGSAR